jgi:uncharacterized SAM-binding protein YcdF (DUF218 family)
VFFTAAKVLWFFAQPSSLIAIAAIAGAALCAAASWKRLGRRLLWGALAALLICGLSPLGDVLIRPLEQRFARSDIGKGAPIAGIIVLGGAEDGRAEGYPEIAALNEAGERYTEAVILARRLPGVRVVFSGGSNRLLGQQSPEAEGAGRLLEALGVPKARIVLESRSRNTYENATLSARLLAPKPGERWLLVTSAWHMPRAIGCFRRAGFAVEAWPVDYRAPPAARLLRINDSIPEGLRRIDVVVREYAGLAAYHLLGRTDALLPGP